MCTPARRLACTERVTPPPAFIASLHALCPALPNKPKQVHDVLAMHLNRVTLHDAPAAPGAPGGKKSYEVEDGALGALRCAMPAALHCAGPAMLRCACRAVLGLLQPASVVAGLVLR